MTRLALARPSRLAATAVVSAGALLLPTASPAVAATQTLHGTVLSHERFCGEEPYEQPEASGVWNLQIKDDRALWSLNLTTDGSKDVAYGGFPLLPVGGGEYEIPGLLTVSVDENEDVVVLEARVARDCTARGYDQVRMTGAIDRGRSLS